MPTDWGQGVPKDAFELGPDERKRRGSISRGGDYYALDRGTPDARYYMRGVLHLPILGADLLRMGLGLWVRMNKRDFDALVGEYQSGKFSDGYPGVISSTDDLALVEPVDGARAKCVPLHPTQRPEIVLLDDDHPITRRQEQGVSIEW